MGNIISILIKILLLIMFAFMALKTDWYIEKLGMKNASRKYIKIAGYIGLVAELILIGMDIAGIK